MSRTFRRKNADHIAPWRLNQPELIDRWDMERYGAHTAEDCLARIRAEFHRDNDVGRYSAPGWYCRIRNRRIARQNTREIRRCLVRQEWDDHLPPRYFRDAGWDWF